MFTNYLISVIITLLIAVLISFYMGKRIKKGSSGTFILIFILGFLSIALNIFSYFLSDLAGIFPLGNSIKKVAFYSLITAGFFREFGKLLVVRMSAMSRSDFNNPADGIVYTLMASLGFTFAALIWNIIFPITETSEFYRSVLTLPANIITAIILGFFLGLGQLRKNVFIDSMTGLFAATFFHAVFELSILTNDSSLILIVFGGSIVIVAILINKAIGLSTAR